MQPVRGKNPILMTDIPDPDVICVDGTFYMITTTMHFMPGGEILRSYDLINWEHASYVFDSIDGTAGQRLEGDEHIYGKGMWAGSIRHHGGEFYVAFSCNDTQKTYIYRSPSVNGPWTRIVTEGFYYDLSLLFDEDRVYVVHGNKDVYITELDKDLKAPKEGGLKRLLVSDTQAKILGYEGSHIYKIDGRYYLFLIHSLPDRWRRVEAMFSADSLDGEFVGGDILDTDLGDRHDGVAQGGIVEGPEGVWHAVLFRDNGALGRIPVVVPVRKENGGFTFETDIREIETTSLRPDYKYRPLVGSDDFRGISDDKEEYGSFGFKSFWQFNHEPDLSLVDRDPEAGIVTIRTDKLSSDMTHARNTLTQRTVGPCCSAEVTVDLSSLSEGDTAGLAILQGKYAYVGITRRNDGYHAVMYSEDKEIESFAIGENEIRLRAECDFEDGRDEVRFLIDTGDGFKAIGDAHKMQFTLDHFTGARFALFVMSEKTVGGQAAFSDFRYFR